MRLRLGFVLVLVTLAVAGGAAARNPKAKPATTVSGGTLNVVAEQGVNGFNVYADCCNSLWTAYEEAPVLLGAFVQEPDGTYQPELVTSVDVATSPSFTLTYHIDPNAVWSDGRPVTAGDFIYTWQQITNPANSVSSTTGYSDITSMTALGSKTVQAVFGTPYADWRSLFAPVLPEHVLTGQDFDTIWTNGINDPSTGAPIGDGPFLMTGFNASLVTLTRNPRWWGPHPAYLNSIVFHVVTDTNTEESEMANGQVQAIFPTIGSYLQPLLAAPGVANQSATSPYLEHLVFNVAGANRGPLEDQAWVRQAIADSIDRTAIANTVFQPLMSVPAAQSLIYFPYQSGYMDNFAGYSYDTSQVDTLMTNHGCTLGGDGIWICGGQRMQFSVEYTEGNQTRQTETNMMQSEAAAAGIDLEPDPIPANVIFGSSGIPGGNFQIGLYAEITTGDPSDWAADYTCGGSGNYTGYCSTGVDNGFDAVNSDSDPAQREADANQVDQLLAADVPELPIFSRPSIIFYSTKVQGLVENPNPDGPLYDAQDISLAPSAPAPTVTSFTPTQGTTGTSVTITGTGLTGATSVSFDGTAASSFTVVTDTKITAVVASGTQTGPITVTGPGGSTTTSADFTTPTTSGGPVSGGTLNVGAEQSTATLNPYAGSLWTLIETTPVLESAFLQQPDGSFQPQLVTSVDVATSPSFTLTYHINPNAVWSDGQPVTATDFIFTGQTIAANSSFASSASGLSGYGDITSMTALDSKTVRVSFNKVVAFWKELFSPVLPQHVLQGHDFTTVWTTLIDDPSTGAPIGDGPFLTTAATSTELTLSRNPNWWGPHAPYLDSIVFHVDQPTEVNDLTSGAVQAIYPAFSSSISDSLTSLRTTSGIATQSNPSPYLENVDFNVGGGGGPLEDQTWVRQAIADAIDRDAIVSSLFGTFSPTTGVSQSDVFFPFQTASYQPDFNAYSYSASAVQSLMVAHGCTQGGDGIWSCGGDRMQYNLEYPSGNATRSAEATMIQSEAAAAGIDIEPDPVPMSQFFGQDLPNHTFQLALFAWIQSGDPSDWDTMYECGGSSNFPQYCNSNVDTAFNSVDTDTNASQRIADANTADSLLAQDVPVLPLWSRPDFLAYSTKVRGLVDNSNLDGPLWDAQDIWMASNAAAPNVVSFTPTKGSGGTTVTITGTGMTGATGVTFGGTAATSFSVVSDTQITATVASGTQSGTVTVTGPGGSGTSSGLFYTPPTVGSFSPASAAQHSTVTVAGTSFRGATSVKVGTTSASFTVVSNTSITFTIPAGATDGTITVTAPAGSATSAGTLGIAPPPAITGLSVTTGSVGTPVTITGTNLDHVVAVEIGHILTVPTSVSATQVVFSIPPGATTGTIEVLGSTGSATSGDTFTVTP